VGRCSDRQYHDILACAATRSAHQQRQQAGGCRSGALHFPPGTAYGPTFHQTAGPPESLPCRSLRSGSENLSIEPPLGEREMGGGILALRNSPTPSGRESPARRPERHPHTAANRPSQARSRRVRPTAGRAGSHTARPPADTHPSPRPGTRPRQAPTGRAGRERARRVSGSRRARPNAAVTRKGPRGAAKKKRHT
jgi:hypothetical protein